MNKQKVLGKLLLCVFCVSLIVWDIYVYLCIGVSHQYDIEYGGIAQIELLNNLWLSLTCFLAINCSVLVLCTILFVTTKSFFKLRLALYSVGIICGLVMLYHSNHLCNRLVDLSISNLYAVNDILKPQYNICIIVNILTTVVLVICDFFYYKSHYTDYRHNT